MSRSQRSMGALLLSLFFQGALAARGHAPRAWMRPPQNTSNDTVRSIESLLVGAMGNKSASGLVGVSKNSENDFETMRTAASFNLLSSLVAFGLFVLCRHLFPRVYAKSEDLPQAAGPDPWHLHRFRGVGILDWAAAVHSIEAEEVQRLAGLDGFMFLEFMALGRRLVTVWAIVFVGLLCPLHYVLHSLSAPGDLLSMTSFNGLVLAQLPRQKQLLLVWAHVVAVWYLILSACRLIYSAQLHFLEHRFLWLKQIPPPRATTILVENLPPEVRSDEALRFYFLRLFGADAIQEAYVVRRSGTLRKLMNQVEECNTLLHLEEAGARRECPCGRADKDSLRSKLLELQAKVAGEQETVAEGVKKMDLKVVSSAGFVTFSSRRVCMLALSPQYRADASQLLCAMPPDPVDVIYEDLAKDPEVKAGGSATAAALLLLIFVIWAPLIATFLDKLEPLISSLPDSELRRFLQGVMSTGVLKMLMSFLPTVFMAIIRNFLTLKAGTWAQLKLQDWFFAFQMVFVLLVTTIVGTVLNVLEKLVAHPGEVVYILADALPGFSDFYINYIFLSCFLQVFDLLRSSALAKYLFWRGRSASELEARELAEPEDQDSDGMGSRMAKVALHLVVCTVFASCSPVILLAAWLYFTVGQYTFGFLISFAETKKPDMGGVFWVKALRHLYLGLLIYILLMVGLLSRTSPTREPVIAAGAAVLALAFGYARFSALSWESLPFEAVADLDLLQQPEASGDYRQAECGLQAQVRESSRAKKSDGTE